MVLVHEDADRDADRTVAFPDPHQVVGPTLGDALAEDQCGVPGQHQPDIDGVLRVHMRAVPPPEKRGRGGTELGRSWSRVACHTALRFTSPPPRVRGPSVPGSETRPSPPGRATPEQGAADGVARERAG